MLDHRQRLVQAVSKEVKPIIEAMVYILVEVKAGKTKDHTIISIVIYRGSGVGVEDCVAVSKNIYPRLEMVEGIDNFKLEISSPGVGRILKAPGEYKIFKGKPVAVLTIDASEWKRGIIDHTNKQSLFLKVNGEIVEIKLCKIKKSKLDFFMEKEKKNVL